MDRVFLGPEVFHEDKAVVSGPDRHHLADVLRVQPGDRFLATDGVGRELLLETVSVGKQELEARVLEQRTRPPGPGRRITLAIAPPKGGRMEIAVEKTVECGIGRIVPLRTSRSVVKAREESSRTERWRRVARSALAQSGRVHLTEISDPQSLTETLEETSRAGRVLLAHPALTASSVTGAIEADPSAVVAIFIGPEGGFTDEELEEAARSGAVTVSLGPTRLRTETAAIVAVTLALASMITSSELER